MNVTLVGPIFPFRGGIAHYTRQLAIGFEDIGHPVTVVSFSRSYPRALYRGESDKDGSLAPDRLPHIEHTLDWRSPASWKRVSDAVVSSAPHLLCINWWTSFWAAPTAHLVHSCRRTDVTRLIIAHNVIGHDVPRLLKAAVKRVIGNADLFLVHSPRELDKLLDMGIQASRVIQEPIPPFEPPTPKVTNAKWAGHVDRERHKVLLFFGFVRPYKGLNTLLDALSILRNQGIAPHLIVAGEFWQDTRLYQDQITRLDLGSQVSLFDGYVPESEVASLFESVDIVVAPYVEGTQSAVVSLAQGYGLPVVASSTIAQAMSSQSQSPVAIFQAGDPSDLARAVVQLLPATRQPKVSVTESWSSLAQRIADHTMRNKTGHAN
ncbi:MAG: glycosyltransferase [Thermoflexales bacterium]|nr:glycosyltransferase [Thermoflexales bacterium]